MSTFGSKLPLASSLNPTDELLITQYVNGQPFTRRLQAQLAYPNIRTNFQTANYTLQASDWWQTMVAMNSSSPTSITIPKMSVQPQFQLGTNILVARYGSGSVTISPGAGVTLRFSSSATLKNQYSVGGIMMLLPDEWVFFGDQT